MLNKTVKKLPGVLQTEVQKEFYAATFDQLFSPANVEQAQGFIGRRTSDVLDPLIDNYLDEPNKNRAAYQLEPIAYAVNAALEDTNQVFYEDLLNYVKHHGGNIDNHDRLFADLYYSFAPPIDVDKFLNYQNYLWLEATDISNTAPIAYIQAPVITATPITGPADFDAIIESLIIGNATFNTSANNQIIPQNFEFSSGMVVQFEGSLSYDEPLYVECVGRSIRLVREQSTLGFDSNVPSDLSIADYITIERGSCEGSPWTRSNRWFHEDAVDAITLLGQLLGGTITTGGVNYAIGDALPVNIGDGTGGVFVVTSVAPFTGAITGIAVGTRGTGYSFATADETGAVPAVAQPLQWDQVLPGGPGTQWDPDAAPVPSGFLTIQGQDELVFDNVSPNGTFFGGVSYSIGDVITMSDGSTITVDNVAVGVITEFTITTSSTSPIFSQGATLTQVSVSPDVGQLGFTLTLDTANELGVVFWDDTTIVTGDGSGAIIEGVLATAVSRSNKASRPILEFKKDLELYNTGARYIGEIDYVAATENFADIHGQAAGVMVDGTTPLVNGDLLIFLNPQSLPSFLSYDELPDGGPTSGTYWDAGPWELSGSADSVIRFVWKVDLVTNPGTIALVQWDIENDVASASALPVGSSVLATQGVDYVGEMFYQFYNLLTDAYNWKLAQSKASANVAPLFNLYDGDGIALNDTIQYPSSDFAGSEIFSYKILTQEQLNALGGGTLVDDNILGFPVETKGFRQLGDIIFENDLEAHRTFYIPTGESSTEIAGYYFYKQFTTNPIDCTYISEAFETNWKSSTGPEELRVIDRFLTTSDTEDTFPLTGVPVAQVLGPANYVVTQGRRLNSSEFAYLPQINSIKLLAHSTLDQSFAGTGSLVAFVFTDITTNFELYVNNLYQVLGIDYTITLQDVTGTTVLMTTPPATAAVVKGSRQASGAPGINEVVELLTYTYDRVQESDLGFFEIPNELENNPNNLEVLEQSWNEFTPHFTSIITEQNVYEGTAFGAGNNYRDTLKDGSLGTFILQNQSPMLKAMLCTSSTELDLVNAIRLSSNEYTRYKNKFIKTAKQLIKEGFTTQEIGDQIPVSEWVDECIRRIIRSREYDTAFNDTYMVAWNTVYDETTFIGNASNVLYTLTDFVDLEDKRNSLYVYIDEILQAIDRDYIISNDNPIQITMTTPPGIGASIAIRIFSATAAAHIPATPTKLGLYTASVPSILTDDTYVNPIQYILGHDGSRTPIYGSVIDELLLEFETRIYNGVTEKFRTNYTVPLTIDTYKPGKFRETRWTATEWNNIIQQSFYKWVAANKADYITNGYYDVANKFSWNYKEVLDIDNEALPGYWRGIFDHYYDTQTPHVTPWEMLGFSSMPTWWTSTALISGDAFTGYGLGPWPDTDPMWIDIEAGLIKRQVDNVTGDLVIGYTDLRYARPDLITKYLPVDMLGALKASPLLCIDVTAALDNPTAAQASADYNWADWSPVEYAWRTSESYPFAVCEAMFLARPGEFGEKFWDPEHIYEVAVDQEQIVSDFDGVYKRIGNADLIVHGETVGGVPQIQTGYQVWIAGQLKSLKKNLSTDFGDLVRSLDVKLGHKMAAFTDKDTLRVFVEGISVTSASSNLLVPAENIDVALYTGAPVQDYFYGGVLIKALPNDVYQVFGYDMTAGRFEYYPRVPAAGDTDVTVGGTPEKFSQFAIGNTYQLAQIVRLNGIFYRCIEVHTATTFDTTKWLKLAKLPITGGVSVTYRKKGADSKDAILYGTKLNGIQQVFDFLVGYGDAQEEDGWTFETVNTANNSINNWLQSAKDYLFWVGTQWEANSLIMLSPMADKVILNVQEGYPANVEKIINGTYSILDKNGVSIDPINTLINREDRLLEVMPDLEQTGIYGLHVITRETENIITFDNTTVFNDVLYDPVLGSRLARLDFRGRRTLEWTGKLEAAGFIITASGLLPNYENMVNSIRNYHNTEVILDNPNIEATARHLIGFDERDYFTDLGILDDAQFQFYQGMVRQKGTRQSIEKMVRNKLVTNTDSELNIIEEWALRLDSYGAVCLNQFTEFLIAADEVRVDPQLVQLYYPATEITPFTHAFDAANDVVGNTIAIVGHGYRTGAPKVYTFVNEGSDSIVGGLTSGSIYYVIVIDDDTFSLATTRNNAVATTPVAIVLTPGAGVAHTLSAFPTGRVTNIDIVSATNVYTIAPTIFITNHPDDTTGSGATATSVLDTDGTLLRIDMLTAGTGYSLPPRIAIGLLTITATSDRATSRIVFDIGDDADSDDVIKIDIDDSSRWITRPNSVACDVALEIWPEVAPTNYNTPNAGYVHADDIDFMAFAESDIDSLSTGSVIPTTHGELIWVARDAREGFGVYMLDGYKASTIINQTHVDFNNTAPNGTFTIGDGYVANERITLSDGTVIRVDSVTGGPPGTVTTFTVLSASTTAFAARGGTTLTAVSSDGAGLGFTLTAGIANEGNGAALPGTGATVTQAPVIEDDGYVTFASIPREDVIPAQFTIDVGGNIVDAVTVIDGGFGYTRDGEFSITDATHGDGHNDTAIIEYRVTTGGDPLTFDGTIQEANVKAGSEGTDYFVKIDTAAINVKGAGYSLNDVLTITGGTGTSATLTVSELSTIAAQDEAVFDGVTAGEGTFTAGTGHTINDVITLTDGSTITINNATVSTITGQTQVNFDNSPVGEGTFTGGSDYLIGELLTMSDGTIIQVEGTLGAAGDPTIVPLVGIPIAEFRIVSPSTATTIYNNEVLTVSVNPGSGGQGFTLTLDVDNVEVTPTTGIVSEFTVTSATTTGITEQAATLAQASSTGTGVNFDITLGDTNQSVFDVTVTTQGRYSNDASLPSATAAATTVVPSGGTGATVDLTFLDDGIVVATDDLPVPTGWRRYMGNAVQDEGQIYAGNVLYDYERVSGSTYLLSKDGTPIENGTFAANTPFFTLLNLRFRTIAERTIFEPVLTLAGVEKAWTDNNGNGLWETSSLLSVTTPGLPVGFVLAMTGFGGEGDALGLTYTSDNDIDVWTEANLSNNVSFPTLGGLVYAASIDTWVAMTKAGSGGANNLSYSTDDGVTWTDRTAAAGFTTSTQAGTTHSGIAWSPTLGLFIAAGNSTGEVNGRVALSSDGQTWTAASPGTSPVVTGSQITAVHWSEGDALFYAGTLDNEIASSADGLTWALTATEPGGAGAANIQTIYSVGTRVFVSRDAGTIHYSDDQGDSWTISTITGVAIGTGDIGGIVSNSDDSVIVAGAADLNNAEYIWRSTDNGVTFASVDVASQLGIANIFAYCLTYDADYGFLQGGTDSTADEQIIMSSPDGLTWTLRLSEKGTHFNSANNPVTSITSVGTLASLTLAGSHTLSNGTTIIISGAVQSEYNGTFVVANAAGATLDYTMLSDPAIDTATGTIEYRYLDQGDIDVIASKGLVSPSTTALTYSTLRMQEDLIDTSKFVNAYVYDNDTKDTLAQIPVYDPYKGILPGNADLNIRWKRARDPARYTNAAAAGTDPADAAINASKLVDADLAFDGDQVGLLWWDTSTSAYMYYEQGTDTYRRDNWGRLFQGSSVDIYEWTRSTLPPASYTGDGIVRNTTDYVLKQEWDSILETVRTFYYFWVKNRTNIPGGVNRTVAAFEVANIITNPLANLYQWFSPISQSGFVFAGVDSVFTDSDNVFQINYRYNDDVRPTHVQWELGRENDASYIVNDIHWNKMVDSLVGYTAEIDIGAMAHTDTIASFNTDATGVDSGTEKITTLTDHGLVSGDGVYYSKAGGIENINLTDGTMYYVEYLSDTELYLHLTNHAAKPIPPTPVNPASRIDITSAGLEVHTLTAQTLELNNFNNALPTAADPLRGYLIVPDPSLSDSNKLGISTRPVQSMFLNIQDARRVWVDKINELVFDIILRDDHPTWNAAMTTNTLWEWVDWYADGYDATNAVPVRQVADTSDLASLPNPFDGDIVKVQGPRYSLYEYSIDSGLYTLIMREDSRLNLLSTIYTDEPSLQASLELRELITALQTEVFVNDSVVNNNLVFFAMLNYVFSEQEDLDWAFKSTYIFIDQTGQVLSQPRVFQEDPFDSALAYITEVKPYQTKIRDYRITRATEIDELSGTASELSRLFTPYLVYDQIRGGDLSITEMRIAKREGQLSTSYKGYSLINDVRLRNGGTGYALDDVLTVVGGTFTTPMTISVTGISGGIITAIGVIDAGVYTVLPGTAATTTVAPSGGTGALIDYASITQVRLGAAGRAVQNYRAELIDIQAPANNGLALIDYSPVTVVPTTEELESIAAINAAITTEFFFDYQGSLLQNTSFGGYPTLQSYTISAPGINYVIGDILQLAAGSGTPISNAQFRVSGIGGSGEITILDLVDGGSYVQTPTIDPVPLLGGSGTGASLTALIFQNGASVPHDSTPWDQIGFESSAHDPSVTTLDGSLTNVITTIPGQTQSSYNGIAPNGSFFGGAGYVAGSAANNYTTGLVFANVGSADTITRTDGTAFDTAGQFSPGQKLIVTASEDAANNGTFTILSVTPTVITLSPSDVLIDSATPPDTTAQLARYDTISMSDGPGGANGTDITVDIVSAGVVTQFTITGGSTAYITAGDTILQSTTSGSGTGFTITTAPATVTTGSFADIPAEETFSGNGSTREFTITTTVPTFFMFVVVDGVEQILNVDFFFIGSKLVFITAPPSGTNNVELYTYIEAGDLINPQVSAGISEEMVPLDPRENLVVIADTQTVTLVAAGTGYVVGEILTLTAGTFTQAMTVQVTAETGGVIDSIVLVDSGEYTVLPGVASPVTSDLAGNNDATITASSDPLSFRIHNDTQQNLLITRNADSMSTTVTVLITSADAVIPVVDVTALYTTPPTRSAPQVAWIGTERIIFHGVNLAANELVGVIRASNGTHAPIGGHPIGTKVFGTEGQTVPTPNVYWVNSATTSYQTGTPTNGIWIYNGHNNIHFSDVVVSTMVTTDSIVVGDTLRVTASIDASIQNSYFIKDIINPGEVGIVIIDNEGSGYSVGDVIPLTGLTVALGPPTTPAVLTVGGVDEDGAITYVYVNDRGTGYTPGGVSINLTGIGDGNASLTLDTLNEGVVLAQGGDIIGTGGVISENFGVSWELDRARPNGLTDATTAAAIFIQAEPGNALSIP